MPPEWGRILGRQTPDETAARADYDALLAGVVEGEVELAGLRGRLSDIAAAARLNERDERKRRFTAWHGLAQRVLADDLLSEREEAELFDAAEALDLDADLLLETSQDLTRRLMIAKANDGRLSVVEEPELMAKPGEIVYLESPAQLMKEVVQRELRGGYGGFSFRIAKGVTFRTGSGRGRSVVTGTSLAPADQGVLSVTGQRLVFLGSRKTQESRYDRLVGLEVFTDAIRVSVSNRQTPSLYLVPDGELLAAVINSAAQEHID